MAYLTLDSSGAVRSDQFSELGSAFFPGDGIDGWKKHKRRFKKVAKRIGKTAGRVVRKDPFYKLNKKVWRKSKPWVKKLAPIILPIAGAILAPFTGGASLVAAALAVQGMKMYEQRKAAKAAYKLDKREAIAIEAEEKKYSADLEKQANKLHAENVATFTQSGYPKAKWVKFSLDEKLAVIDRINRATEAGATPPPPAKPPAPKPPAPTPAWGVQNGKPPGPAPAGKRWVRLPASRQPDAPLVWRLVSGPAPKQPPPKPTIHVLPIEYRKVPEGRMGDPATVNPITRPSCPAGFIPQMEDLQVDNGEHFAHYAPVATSVAYGGAGGYLITHPTPRQKVFMQPVSTASLLNPRRGRKRGRVNASRRSHGLWKMAPIRTASMLKPNYPGNKRWETEPFGNAANAYSLDGLGAEDGEMTATEREMLTRLRAIQLHAVENQKQHQVYIDRIGQQLRSDQALIFNKGQINLLKRKYTTEFLKMLGVRSPQALNRTDPAHAVAIAVRADMADTADRIDMILSQGQLQRRVTKLRAEQVSVIPGLPGIKLPKGMLSGLLPWWLLPVLGVVLVYRMTKK